jgi:hypothetical protein
MYIKIPNVLWPKITDTETAKYSACQGIIVVIWEALKLTYAQVFFFGGYGNYGPNLSWVYLLYLVIYIYIGYEIFKCSIRGAVYNILLLVLIFIPLHTSYRDWTTIRDTIIFLTLLLFSINSIRGTRAYSKFRGKQPAPSSFFR